MMASDIFRQKQVAGRGTLNNPFSQPAPVGGLNLRDGLMLMPPTDAIQLTNWIPQQLGVRTRKGYREWCTNLTGEVRTIMAYLPDRNVPAAPFVLFAATDNNIFDVTASSSAPPVSAVLGGGANVGRFSHVMMSNAAGQFLLACSHEGGYRYWNGAAWTVPVIVGVANASLCYVATWKRRSWFIEKNTSKVWYSAVDALTGTFNPIDLGPFMKHGGSLSFIANWTIDAGEGVDDFIVFGGENGDILVFQGTDPSAAATFSMVGTWYVGRLPIGRRVALTFGGDLLVISEMGIQPLSYVTRGGQSMLRASAVDYLGKVQPRLAELVGQLSDAMGWDLMLFPRENLMIVNKPLGGVNLHQQYALYTNTNGWCVLENMPMTCGTVAGNEFYFGTEDGKVCLGFSGFFDNVPLGSDIGDGIRGIIQMAYNYFGLPAIEKQWHLLRPNFLATDRPSVIVQMMADFQQYLTAGSPVSGTPSGDLWDVGLWDAARWAGDAIPFLDWYGVGAVGMAGSAALTTVAIGDTYLASLDHVFERTRSVGIG